VYYGIESTAEHLAASHLKNPESFWQELLPPHAAAVDGAYPARFDDGRILMLPLRPLPDGRHALASLIINQASFAVVDALATALARKLAAFAPEVIVGLPTLGLTLAAAVAERLGHSRYVPLGTSAKFWYRAELSVPLSSVTTPDQTKRLYIDPRTLPLLAGRRIALVDDVISSGRSMRAGIDLLAACGFATAVLGTAMLQTDAWREALAAWDMAAVLTSPLLTIASDPTQG
jgi:adenine/guanine phosphoribosyltransferase-like PRPP-binding protein